MNNGKVQTNLNLSSERAATLDLAPAIEGKYMGSIVEVATRLRE